MAFHFFNECLEAITKLKEALTTTTILRPPFELMWDAADYAIGVVLRQCIDKKSHVIYYASHTLNDTQMNYTVIEKEFFSCGLCLWKV